MYRHRLWRSLSPISPYIHSYWKELHVKNSCVCVDNEIAIPIINQGWLCWSHSSNTSWEQEDDDMAVHAWWSFMQRDLLSKTTKCNLCVKIGKNLKSIVPPNKWAPSTLCKVPNEEIQRAFGGTIFNEKNQEDFFLAYKDRFSEFSTTEVFDRASAQNKCFKFPSRLHIITWLSSHDKIRTSKVSKWSSN